MFNRIATHNQVRAIQRVRSEGIYQVGSIPWTALTRSYVFRRTLHNYILWRLVMSIMPHMIDEYQQKRIEFRKILLGILSERNRWSQCVEWTNKKLGMAVGALFIRDNFNHESKVREECPSFQGSCD